MQTNGNSDYKILGRYRSVSIRASVARAQNHGTSLLLTKLTHRDLKTFNLKRNDYVTTRFAGPWLFITAATHVMSHKDLTESLSWRNRQVFKVYKNGKTDTCIFLSGDDALKIVGDTNGRKNIWVDGHLATYNGHPALAINVEELTSMLRPAPVVDRSRKVTPVKTKDLKPVVPRIPKVDRLPKDDLTAPDTRMQEVTIQGIVHLLTVNYDPDQGYLNNWSDESIAAKYGVIPDVVAKWRVSMYGEPPKDDRALEDALIELADRIDSLNTGVQQVTSDLKALVKIVADKHRAPEAPGQGVSISAELRGLLSR